MPLKKFQLKTTHEHQKQRLDQVLSQLLPDALGEPLSKAKIRKLIVAGAVYLNQRRVRIASKEILANAKIDVYVDLAKLHSDGASKDRKFEMSASDILFEDEFIIVVNKPPGLPTQATLDEARDNLFAAAKKFIAQRDKVAQPYLALHHRLDRDTSGVLLLVKDPKANAPVADIFSQHRAQKVYQAISSRGSAKFSQAWCVEDHLAKNKSSGKVSRFHSVKSGGDYAKTDFQLIEDLGRFAWIEARPKTGRTHQIRVHLSEKDLPIVGDATYGGDLKVAPRLMLHAARLTFPHPIHQTELSIESPIPKDFIQCLQRLNSKNFAKIVRS